MSEGDKRVGMAPEDFTDGRDRYSWESKYTPDANRRVLLEAVCLVVLVLASLVAVVLLWLDIPARRCGLSPGQCEVFRHYAYAGVGGVLGGCLFSLKWLYHSVAKGIWHLDRQWWRMLTPIISGGLAFAFFVLMHVGGLGIVRQEVIDRGPTCYGMGFLVGFFSDSALAKLTEVAHAVFGETSRGGKV